MKKTITILIIFLLFTPFLFPQNRIIDHKAAKIFDSIPSEIVQKAINMRYMFRHASVGTTIDGGLNCLQGTKSKCTQYPQYKFDRRQWAFQGRGNSGWFGKISDFTSQVAAQLDSFDIFAFKYCYLDGLDQVDEPCGRYPSNPAKVQKAWDSLRNNMNSLEASHPTKTFVWWTIPLTQVGQGCTDEMNKLIRDYCRENNKWLFDIADIECHDTLDNHVTNLQGWEIAFKPYCGEQKPDAQACHPNDFGALILAKALWVNIAKIAGWIPSVPSEVTDNIAVEFSISPNPATDYIEISYSPLEKGVRGLSDEIRIYNIFGQEVYPTLNPSPAVRDFSGKLHDTLPNGEGWGGVARLDISSLPVGVYFVKLGNKVNKFLKY